MDLLCSIGEVERQILVKSILCRIILLEVLLDLEKLLDLVQSHLPLHVYFDLILCK